MQEKDSMKKKEKRLKCKIEKLKDEIVFSENLLGKHFCWYLKHCCANLNVLFPFLTQKARILPVYVLCIKTLFSLSPDNQM